jgi:hypothetical protein
MPREHARQVTLIGEATTNSNLTEWRGTFVDQALRQCNAPVQHPTMW